MHGRSIFVIKFLWITACTILYATSLFYLVPPLQTKFRDHDARDYYKARRQHRVISDDLLGKDVQIEDTKKRIKELEMKLADFATAYEVHVQGVECKKVLQCITDWEIVIVEVAPVDYDYTQAYQLSATKFNTVEPR